MKILIVGFGRSGTTLTYRIFKKHSMITKGFLETYMIAFDSKKEFLKKHPTFERISLVEKDIYGEDKIRKRSFGVLDLSIYDYCKRWLDYFEEEARIVQIIRYPLDTLSSLIIKRGRLMKVRKNLKEIIITDIKYPDRKKLIDSYFKVVPKYPKLISTLPQTKTFKYEDIILKKEYINEMFNFCGLPPSEGKGEKLRVERAFNYKSSGFMVEESIEEIIKVFNEISNGIKYENI